ncbi:unnamed protein product [Symbiodinium necroappetens]|uniref:Apple domain-containing protein n=1 Tax=Symbiodinium necroappetens TaxID=1628268 RepID=A0A812T5D3_9DINO|nr:unnamed protein product [Symbiodinium necroappetens]
MQEFWATRIVLVLLLIAVCDFCNRSLCRYKDARADWATGGYLQPHGICGEESECVLHPKDAGLMASSFVISQERPSGFRYSLLDDGYNLTVVSGQMEARCRMTSMAHQLVSAPVANGSQTEVRTQPHFVLHFSSCQPLDGSATAVVSVALLIPITAASDRECTVLPWICALDPTAFNLECTSTTTTSTTATSTSTSSSLSRTSTHTATLKTSDTFARYLDFAYTSPSRKCGGERSYSKHPMTQQECVRSCVDAPRCSAFKFNLVGNRGQPECWLYSETADVDREPNDQNCYEVQRMLPDYEVLAKRRRLGQQWNLVKQVQEALSGIVDGFRGPSSTTATVSTSTVTMTSITVTTITATTTSSTATGTTRTATATSLTSTSHTSTSRTTSDTMTSTTSTTTTMTSTTSTTTTITSTTSTTTTLLRTSISLASLLQPFGGTDHCTELVIDGPSDREVFWDSVAATVNGGDGFLVYQLQTQYHTCYRDVEMLGTMLTASISVQRCEKCSAAKLRTDSTCSPDYCDKHFRNSETEDIWKLLLVFFGHCIAGHMVQCCCIKNSWTRIVRIVEDIMSGCLGLACFHPQMQGYHNLEIVREGVQISDNSRDHAQRATHVPEASQRAFEQALDLETLRCDPAAIHALIREEKLQGCSKETLMALADIGPLWDELHMDSQQDNAKLAGIRLWSCLSLIILVVGLVCLRCARWLVFPLFLGQMFPTCLLAVGCLFCLSLYVWLKCGTMFSRGDDLQAKEALLQELAEIELDRMGLPHHCIPRCGSKLQVLAELVKKGLLGKDGCLVKKGDFEMYAHDIMLALVGSDGLAFNDVGYRRTGTDTDGSPMYSFIWGERGPYVPYKEHVAKGRKCGEQFLELAEAACGSDGEAVGHFLYLLSQDPDLFESISHLPEQRPTERARYKQICKLAVLISPESILHIEKYAGGSALLSPVGPVVDEGTWQECQLIAKSRKSHILWLLYKYRTWMCSMLVLMVAVICWLGIAMVEWQYSCPFAKFVLCRRIPSVALSTFIGVLVAGAYYIHKVRSFIPNDITSGPRLFHKLELAFQDILGQEAGHLIPYAFFPRILITVPLACILCSWTYSIHRSEISDACEFSSLSPPSLDANGMNNVKDINKFRFDCARRMPSSQGSEWYCTELSENEQWRVAPHSCRSYIQCQANTSQSQSRRPLFSLLLLVRLRFRQSSGRSEALPQLQ